MKKLIIFMLIAFTIFSKELTVALGDSLPPYIILPKGGLEYDIISKSLAYKGHKMKASYVPFARLFKSIEDKKYDAVATVKELEKKDNVYYSDEYVVYENIVVSLEKFKIDRIEDLKNKKIIAFQNSKFYLGLEYEKVVSGNPLYSEIANQEAQVASLMNGRTDLIVIDEKIFKYYMKSSKLFKPKTYSVYRIFSPTPYKVAFKDKIIRDDFNLGLKALKTTGEYDKIIKKYTD